MKGLIDQLYRKHELSGEELLALLGCLTKDDEQYLFGKAAETRERYYGKSVYLRGLVEFTNYCKRNCKYCGIRAGNRKALRYRLTPDEILEVCRKGYALGFRTFVLQGGEDDYYTDRIMNGIIHKIKRNFEGSAVTLSIGEKPKDTYQGYFDAGADRYLLRHETASDALYQTLHPGMTLASRKRCLRDLKAIGFQVGAGFMVGLPGQTDEHLVEDLLFLKELEPHMAGIGPFIPHQDTPLGGETGGTAEKTLRLVALTRLLLPHALLPSTTALGTVDAKGREKGLRAGANVVMPNLSPAAVRSKYSLYDGKICTDDEAEKCLGCISGRIRSCGLVPDLSRGDHTDWRNCI